MNPQERALVTELFDRLATLENTLRDPEAERLIADGSGARAQCDLRPGADRRCCRTRRSTAHDARIRELEESASGQRPASGGFLDAAREHAYWAEAAVRCLRSHQPREVESPVAPIMLRLTLRRCHNTYGAGGPPCWRIWRRWIVSRHGGRGGGRCALAAVCCSTGCAM